MSSLQNQSQHKLKTKYAYIKVFKHSFWKSLFKVPSTVPLLTKCIRIRHAVDRQTVTTETHKADRPTPMTETHKADRATVTNQTH